MGVTDRAAKPAVGVPKQDKGHVQTRHLFTVDLIALALQRSLKVAIRTHAVSYNLSIPCNDCTHNICVLAYIPRANVTQH